MKIELGKTYATARGDKVRIIAVDRKDSGLPIVGLTLRKKAVSESVDCYTEDGTVSGSDAQRNLVAEWDEWQDVPIDTLVWVRNEGGWWETAYFAGVRTIGGNYPTVFPGGRSSFTCSTTIVPHAVQRNAIQLPKPGAMQIGSNYWASKQ